VTALPHNSDPKQAARAVACLKLAFITFFSLSVQVDCYLVVTQARAKKFLRSVIELYIMAKV